MTERTYGELLGLALALLAEGQSVVLDAKYDRVNLRQQVLQTVGKLPISVRIIHPQAPVELLRERLHLRTGDIADATADLLAQQLQQWEPFSETELAWVTTVDTTLEPAAWELGLSL
ncbi:Putative kinase [Gloeomargarita lithophora Alchichica-D10]|uniref:Kinase n=2 Tax=Gloeomargarita TaxID=1188227 RepID=A0A1J0AFE0_9CYAN|nr:Putative kinase [Gloeomargarita lithophora Alchichica-D10]